MFVDTHAHLNFSQYQDNLPDVLARSREAGVEKIICASSNVADSEKAVALAEQYPGNIYAAVGIHPQQTDPANPDSLAGQLEKLQELAAKKEVVAIGECGLDYSPAPPGEKDRAREEQVFLFQSQIELAQKLSLPLIIHAREAVDETINILAKYSGVRGVFHCYAGGRKRIQKIIDLHFLFGFDGNLTYDQGLQNVVASIDLNRILLETDSPLLTPEPFRGGQNEPKNVRIIASKLAEVKSLHLAEVERITTENAEKLFRL
jgi:TatD DNase family protein